MRSSTERRGTLEFAGDRAAAGRLRGQQQMFPNHLKWLDAVAAREYEPSVSEGIEGALWAPSQGYVRVPQLMAALVGSAESDGAVFRTGTRASGIRRTAGGLQVDTDTAGALRARHVVVACGSWSDLLNVESGRLQGMRPVRGQLLRVGWNGPPIARVLWSAECYVVPWREGTLLVGATVEDVGIDQRTTLAGVRDLIEAVCGLLPGAWRATFHEARAALRPESADGLSVVGPSDRVEG